MKRIVLILIILGLLGLAFPQNDLEDFSIEELLHVDVLSANQKALRVSEAPSVIRVITANDFQEKGYRSVGEAISSVPGLYVYFDGVNYIVNVRGITSGMRGLSRIIKVMIDNQPVQFAFSGANFLGEELIPIDAVERIEVILGPGSTLYGSDAFMGIINIVTKNGNDVNGGLVSLALGTENSRDMSYGANGVFGKKINSLEFFAALSGFGLNRTGLKIPESSIFCSGVESENGLAHPYSFYGKLSLDMQKIGMLSLIGSFQYLDTYAEFADWGILTHDNRISLNNYFARLLYEKKFKNNLFTSANIVFSSGGPNETDNLNYGSEVLSIKRDFGFQNMSFNALLEYAPSDKLGFAMGADILSENYNLGQLWALLDQDYGEYYAGDSVEMHPAVGDTGFSQYGVYTQAIYKPTESLNFTQGIIYSNHSTYGDFYNARFGTVFKFSDQGHCKFLFGTSFNPPSPEHLFAVPMYAGDAIGNPNLIPEETQTFDFEINPIQTEDLSASFDMFYNTIENKIGYIYRDGLFEADNFGKINIMGVEGLLRWDFKNLSASWNLSYQKTETTDETESDSISGIYTLVKQDVFEYPAIMSYTSFSYMVPQIKTGITFEQRYIGERSATQSNIVLNNGEEYKLGAYQVFNLTLYTKQLKLLPFGRTKFSLSIRNLTDELFIEPGNNGIDIPGNRRTLYFQVVQKF